MADGILAFTGFFVSAAAPNCPAGRRSNFLRYYPQTTPRKSDDR